jgi:hypothetical protein
MNFESFHDFYSSKNTAKLSVTAYPTTFSYLCTFYLMQDFSGMGSNWWIAG